MQLSLETWRRIIAYDPLHFWQLWHATLAPVTDGCHDIVRQYAWQAQGAVGRDEIARAITEAERKLRVYLGYAVGARAVTFADRIVGAAGGIRLPEQRIQALGTVTATLLGTAAITLLDADGDGLYDTFTATLPTALTAIPDGTLRAAFVAADQVARQRDDWRIWPVSITATLAGTVTIAVSGPSAMLVSPAKLEGRAGVLSQFAAQDAASYVSQIAIWLDTIDATQAVVIDGQPYTASITDARRGMIALDPCQHIALACQNGPLRATVACVAGDPLGADGDLAPFWQPIVAQLAAAEISGQPCGCASANAWLYHWQFDVSRVKGGEEEFAFKDAAQGNPFGTRRGHIAAWHSIRELIQPRGFAV